jgi:hypothetical protein
MPDEQPVAADKASAIEAELQAAIDDAKADVAADAAHTEQKRIDEERLTALERRLSEVESRAPAPASAPVPVETPEPSDEGGALAELSDRVEALAEAVIDPVEDAAEAVIEPVAELAEDAAEVVEEIPKRTHALFARPFSRHD